MVYPQALICLKSLGLTINPANYLNYKSFNKMKQLLTLLLLFVLTFHVQAQAPGKFKYQAVARNTNNQPYSNTTLRIRFAMLENSASGTVRYLEEHTVTTSALGVFEANIGGGTVIQGSLNNVFWGEHAYFIRVELNPQPTGGSFILMGTSQLLSVPYAIYSAQTGSGGDQTLDISGTELSISNGNTITLPTPSLDISGNELSISYGNTVMLPTYQAGPGIQISGQQISAQDDSDTNELQTLELNGDELSISNGNSVILPHNGFSLPYYGNLSNSGNLFTVVNSGSGGAIHGITYGGGEAAVVGEDPTGGLAGVRGYSSSSYGVLGYSDSGEGVLGQSGSGVGVMATSSGGGTALVATNTSGLAIQATNYSGGTAISTEGSIQVHTTGSTGIYLQGGSNIGVLTDFSFETGVMANGDRFGVVGQSSDYGGYFSGETAAVFAFSNTGGYSGNFPLGPLYAQTMQKGSGSFKIDHPLDPANKYLYHSFVESPDMMNVYNGNVTTDANGLATVELPDYFEALNRDFRYQLTTIGGFAQLTIEREVANNTFSIRSDKPNVKVSWQVTGIRQDAHANQFRIVPTVEKEDKNKGKYLCPTCFHQPEAKGLFYEEMHLKDTKQK
jgi:predicted phage tail protein